MSDGTQSARSWRRAVPLDRADVDTDQIIPSDWLKRVERTGFGEGLFSEWRESSDFVLNQEQYDGAQILVAGPNFGMRLVARARAVGARGLRLPGGDLAPASPTSSATTA